MSFINPFKAVYPRLDKIYQQEIFFAKAKHFFPIYNQNGFYDKTEENALYILKKRTEHRTFLGIISATPIDYYLNGQIIRHEGTLVEKEQKQIKLSRERNGLIKPILLTYPKVQAINDLLERYVKEHTSWYQISFRKSINTFWKITDQTFIEKISNLFDQHVPKTYIADGHHRTAIASHNYNRWREENKNHTGKESYNYIFTSFFSNDQIEIQDFNRVLANLNGLTALQFIAKLANVFEIEPIDAPYKPTEKNHLGLYLNEEWFKLKWKKTVLEKYRKFPLAEQLDVSILAKEVLTGILNIENIKSDKRVQYVESDKGLVGVMKKVGKYKNEGAGFTLFPVNFDDFKTITDNNRLMPPKSTYFLPRLYNGLLGYLYDEY